MVWNLIAPGRRSDRQHLARSREFATFVLNQKTCSDMRTKKSFKHWRMNVVALYYEEQLADLYRNFLLGMLKDLANIYWLDYAISLDHPFPAVDDSPPQTKHESRSDLFYFRSNENSRVDRKKLRSVIDGIFDNPISPSFLRVEVFHQVYKALPLYPFPKVFYRPVSYPFVERHEGNRIRLCLYSDPAMNLIEKEQDFPEN